MMVLTHSKRKMSSHHGKKSELMVAEFNGKIDKSPTLCLKRERKKWRNTEIEKDREEKGRDREKERQTGLEIERKPILLDCGLTDRKRKRHRIEILTTNLPRTRLGFGDRPGFAAPHHAAEGGRGTG